MTLHWFVLSIGAFAAALGAHAIACRLPLPGNRVAKFLVVGIVAGGLVAWIAVGRYGLLTPHTAAVLFVYAFACEMYIFLFTMTIGSVSSNLLIRLSGGEMRLADIQREYDSEAMVKRRFERLISTGFLEWSGNGVALTVRGLRFVLLFRRLRRFFGHG